MAVYSKSKSSAVKDALPTDNHHSSILDSIVIPDPAHCTEPVDLDQDIIEVFRRYESIYCSFLLFKLYTGKLDKVLTMSDVGKCVQDTLVDYSVAFAMLGVSHVERIQMNMQYTVLQSALILTISMPLYIQLPSFSSTQSQHIFSAIVGFAAFQQLIVIIGCTIISALLNRPYVPCDGTVARYRVFLLLILVSVVNYIASVATLAAMLVAGFARHFIDGVVQLYVILVVFYLVKLFAYTNSLGVNLQDKRVVAFYEKYCEPQTGRLKEEYLKLVYMPQEDEEEESEEDENAVNEY